MSNDQSEKGTKHVLRRGMTQLEAQPYGDGRIRVVKRKCRHKFNEGYQPVGPEREIYDGHVMDAAHVADILSEVFESER